MNTTSLSWPLALGLGAFALVRPVTRIVADQLDIALPAPTPGVLTLVISVIWIAVVGMSRVARPVLTLVLAGLTYAVLSIALSGVLSPILTGELQGPLAQPIAIVPALLVNALWGVAAGAVALLVQHLRGARPERVSEHRAGRP